MTAYPMTALLKTGIAISLAFLGVVIGSTSAVAQARPEACTDACERPCYFGLCPLPPEALPEIPAEPVGEQPIARQTAFGDWGVFEASQQGKKLCWIGTYARERRTGKKFSGATALFIVGVDQLTFDFRAVDDPLPLTAYLQTPIDTYGVFFQDDTAWVADPADDRPVQIALAEGNQVRLNVNDTVLSFSGTGFLSAYSDAKSRCASS